MLKRRAISEADIRLPVCPSNASIGSAQSESLVASEEGVFP
jgi:hypothetical protein